MNKIKSLRLWPHQIFTAISAMFVGGILIGGFWTPHWHYSWPIIVTIGLLLALSSFLNLLLKNHNLSILSWMLVALLLGIACYSYRSVSACALPDGEVTIQGVIANNPIKDFKKQQVILEADLYECAGSRILANLPHYPEYQYGQVLKLQGELKNPGMIEEFDYERYLRPKSVSYLLMNPHSLEVIGEEKGYGNQIIKSLYGFKNRIEKSIFNSIREPEASLGAGIITGFRASITDDLKDALNNAGLTHLVALSGFNITIIITAVSLLLAGRLSRRGVFVAGVMLSVAFVVMTGAAASVVRATIFALLVLLGQIWGRKAYQTNILLLTGGLMLAINPFLLRDDMGFQLSFLAFAGLIYLTRPVRYLLGRLRLLLLPDFIVSPLTETLSAQIAVFPLIAFAFGRVSLISPISNILVLAVIPWAMLLTFITALSGLMLPLLGNIVGLFAWPLLAYVVAAAEYTARLPLASVAAPKYSLVLITVCYMLIIFAYIILAKRMKKTAVI